MKKLKWILLLFLILLAVLFLFATCKKTKAMENIYNNINFSLDCLDSNSGAVLIYSPANITSATDNFRLEYNVNGGTNFIVMSSFNDRIQIYANGIGTIDSLSFTQSYQTINYYFAIFGCNYVDNNYELTLNYGYCYSYNTSNDVYIDSHTIDFSQLVQLQDNLNSSYESNDIVIYPAYYYSPASYNGTYNTILYSIYDYNFPTVVFSEYLPDVIDNILKPNINKYTVPYYYNEGYQRGYDAGYQQGWDDGYALGRTEGYDDGYDEGYEDGINDNQTAFDRGYDEGLADGYADGQLAGYDDGYADGYEIGEQAGLQGATPVSQTVTLIGSIFGAIGTVLSIELFPGFTLGILILVPLFFSVLGLILWIWRRN